MMTEKHTQLIAAFATLPLTLFVGSLTFAMFRFIV